MNSINLVDNISTDMIYWIGYDYIDRRFAINNAYWVAKNWWDHVILILGFKKAGKSKVE